MERQPLCTVRVIAQEPRCTLVFEPVGSEHEMFAGDEVVIHVFGESLGPGDKDADVEVGSEPGRITVWIARADYRVWDKAGNELTV